MRTVGATEMVVSALSTTTVMILVRDLRMTVETNVSLLVLKPFAVLVQYLR